MLRRTCIALTALTVAVSASPGLLVGRCAMANAEDEAEPCAHCNKHAAEAALVSASCCEPPAQLEQQPEQITSPRPAVFPQQLATVVPVSTAWIAPTPSVRLEKFAASPSPPTQQVSRPLLN